MTKYWKRNEALVDLSKVPEELKAKILNKLTKTPKGNMNKVFNYFVENRMMLLMEEIENFKEKEYQTYNDMVEL